MQINYIPILTLYYSRSELIIPTYVNPLLDCKVFENRILSYAYLYPLKINTLHKAENQYLINLWVMSS